MSRIPQDELDRLKREVALERLCERYGVHLKPHGKDLIGLCPFHEDHSPSFVVTPAKNLWNCLGKCGAGGSVVDFIMRKESVSFRRAVEILRELRGQAPPSTRLKTHVGTEHPILAPPGPDLDDRALLDRVTEFYHQTFCNDPVAMQYLARRKCFHPEAVKVFKLGYANRTLGYRVPRTTADGRRLKERLTTLGIFRKPKGETGQGGHEHLCGSVVFPILDRHGHTAQMYGRKVTPKLRPGTPDHLYLPGDHRGVWNEAALLGQREWLVCEALIDALTLWSAGFRNVTAAYGVNGFTPDHWRLVDEAKPSRIVLCFDNDAAGNSAAAALRPKLEARGVQVLRCRLPEGADVNDVACSSANPTAALAAILEGLGESPLVSPKHESEGGSCAPAFSLVAPELAAKPEATSSFSPTDKSAVASAKAEVAEIAAKPEPVEPVPVAPASPVPTTGKAAKIEESTGESGIRNSDAIASAVGKENASPAIERHGEDLHLVLGNRRYRVRGLAKNTAFEVMKVNLLVRNGGEDAFHVDTLDLYNARNRQAFVAAAAEELSANPETIRKDLGRMLMKLEQLQEETINRAIEPETKTPPMTEEERAAALALLRDPKLLDRILADFERCGVVGEETNKLVAYLAAVSRKLEEPLAVLIQSTSAAGKTALMDAVLALLPDEDQVKYSAMTGQSLFYLGDLDLQHKVLAIVEEEGALKASYALKLLQSEGELTIASTGKDPNTGRMVTQEYRVEGPVMIILTTTSIEIGEELQNRCVVLTVDESREQTRAIHRVQRERYTLEGLLAKRDRETIRRTHQNAQRLLRPLGVLNPYARQLTFLDDKTRTRRDHEKYLTLIAAIALLHQHQRPVRTRDHHGKSVEYIEATLADIETANRLAAEVLGRSLDELPPQTRRFLDLLTAMVKRECQTRKIEREHYRFTQREIRFFSGWSDMQVKRHLAKLVDLEYVLVHRGGRGQSFVYELLYDGQGRDGGKFVLGLIDVNRLYDPNRGGPEGQWGGQKGEWGISGAGQGRPKGGLGAVPETPRSPSENVPVDPPNGQNARPGGSAEKRRRSRKAN
jgi:DNA primase catalytic core